MGRGGGGEAGEGWWGEGRLGEGEGVIALVGRRKGEAHAQN